ncbi:site-specific integrase [Actinotalea ferrariae]|uniref:tyrosine-type recombinase/integrase n=1 Tax=Actinotalea ferrariae TaxID=1386098 RepID=UPI001C8C57A4|nr:site-specific integrase [Actinotalea ferrariae]MBX9243429.1 site-specific integrase [Actinotalea ferrariae]
MASIQKRPEGKWRARYRDEAGKEHARHFDRKTDAQRWLNEVTASVVTGQYVAPTAGKITLREYAEQWRANQAHRPSTREQVERHFRRHVYPSLGDRPLSTILPSDLKALVRRLSVDLEPATVSVIYRHLSAVFKAAVLDRRIASSPCAGVSVPKPRRAKVVPVSTEAVQRLAEAMPERYRALVILAAGTGMRPGEVFGLTVDRVDFLRRRVIVDRQLVTVAGREPFLGPVKTESSDRIVPLPQVVVNALAAHLAVFPAAPDELVFRTATGRPLRRSTFGDIWRAAVTEAGIEGLVPHGLRHYYASLLIRHGESVKTVQERLGHASAVETLDTYSHLWPDSDDRTREAVDSVLLGTATTTVPSERAL